MTPEELQEENDQLRAEVRLLRAALHRLDTWLERERAEKIEALRLAKMAADESKKILDLLGVPK